MVELMGELTIERLYRVSTPGAKAKWEFDARSIIMVENRPFVKLPRACFGFAKLVFEGCADVPDPLPKGYSLTASLGYTELATRRNNIQAQHLLDKERELVPELFRNTAPVPSRPSRQTRESVTAARKHPESITMTLPEISIEGEPPASIELLRPVHSKDDLCVLLEVSVLQNVIAFLKQGGWAAENTQARRKNVPADAPKGIIYRKDKRGNAHFPQGDAQ